MRPRHVMRALLVGVLWGVAAGAASEAAIEPADARQPVVRHTVQNKAVVDARGSRWKPARHVFRGGRNQEVPAPAVTSGSPGLYRVARVGVRKISMRVPRRGRYAVVLYFAEPKARPNLRTFHVIAEGKRARSGVEVFHGTDFLSQDFGIRNPLHAVFETVVDDGRLNIRFRRVSGGRPVVSAVHARRLGSVRMPGLQPLWSDDFNGPEGTPPDPALWKYETGIGWAHNELQAHTDRTKNASLDGAGHLNITAREEHWEENGKSAEWTSARLNAVQSISLRRTLISTRIRFPEGHGLWSIFWFWGDQPSEFPYPYNGELDVAEVDGGVDRRLRTFFHYGETVDGEAQDSQFIGGRDRRQALWDIYTRYDVRTVPGAVEISASGRRYCSWTAADMPRRARWPFNANMFTMILSLAVGGDFVDGAPPPSTKFPATMTIDYMRVSR